mmetsp:Transcript_89276/g.251242  ORF Transcript_89276/g.251242 Transcript_89276/m.251242 type:complete len:404 (-) Transcript_89276:69-1280(-)
MGRFSLPPPACKVGEQIKVGYLEKQSRHLKVWRRRWSVLTPYDIRTFASSRSGDRLTEIISLEAVRVEFAGESLGPAGVDTTFRVLTGKRSFYFRADSSSSKISWVLAIRSQSEAYNGFIEPLWNSEVRDASLGLDQRGLCLLIVRQRGRALVYASEEIRADREVVVAAVQNDGFALKYASECLRGTRDVALSAIKQNGRALQFVAPPLGSQDPDLLHAAGLMQDRVFSGQCIVLSVRFALTPAASGVSSQVFFAMLDLFPTSNVYNPNIFSKGFCGVLQGADGEDDWSRVTDKTFPCRGECSIGRPNNQSCWRYSFRWHLQKAKASGGFMLQVIEDSVLGAGQEIEEEMARGVKIPIFQVSLAASQLHHYEGNSSYQPDANLNREMLNLCNALRSAGLAPLR